jgi:hypothetical protein
VGGLPCAVIQRWGLTIRCVQRITNVSSHDLKKVPVFEVGYRHQFQQMVIQRVGQNRIYTLYMTVYLVISLQKKTYIHHIYMVLANPSYTAKVS